MSQDQCTAEEALDQATEARIESGSAAQRERRFELSAPQVLAGALAAASAAVAASWLGLAGTVLGAVVASIVVPVSTALYKHPLERSSQVIRESLPLRPERPGSAEASLRFEANAIAPALGAERRTGASGMPRRRVVRWGAVAVSCLLTLVVGFAMLTALEAMLGRSVSSLTGSGGHDGTTVGRLVHHGTSGSGAGTGPAVPATPAGGGVTPPSAGTTSDQTTTGSPTTSPATTAPPTTAPTTSAPTSAAPSTSAPASISASGHPPNTP